MKHQYFGDINDYCKYGILRAIAHEGLKTILCWMLTEDDSRTDGRRTNYLQKKELYRHHDPVLFDALVDIVETRKQRNTTWFQKSELIVKAKYYNEILHDNVVDRVNYFERLENQARGSDLVFFDPDNGIEVNSTLKGNRDSSKYVYWDEIEQFWNLGYSLLIYQHFPRVNRKKYIRDQIRKLRTRTGSKDIIAFNSTYVAFFLLIKGRHRKQIHRAVESIQKRWRSIFETAL